MQKYSKQREDVLNYLKNSHTHLTAEQIYLGLKKQNSTASRGTVYRNLNKLIYYGIVSKIPIENQPDKFDYIHKPHSHALCKECGKVFDFEYNFNAENLIKQVEEQTDMEDVASQILIYGICKNCKSKFKEDIL